MKSEGGEHSVSTGETTHKFSKRIRLSSVWCAWSLRLRSSPRFSRRVGALFPAVFSRNFFAGDRMSEPCHCHIADRPLLFKRQEICTGVPGRKTFCILRVLRQTSKGSRPMHSGLEDESKLDVQKADWTSDHCHRHIAGRTLHSKWREVCTGYLDSQSLHFASFRHSFPVGVFLRVLQVEDAQFSP